MSFKLTSFSPKSATVHYPHAQQVQKSLHQLCVWSLGGSSSRWRKGSKCQSIDFRAHRLPFFFLLFALKVRILFESGAEQQMKSTCVGRGSEQDSGTHTHNTTRPVCLLCGPQKLNRCCWKADTHAPGPKENSNTSWFIAANKQVATNCKFYLKIRSIAP